jgi:hypothetical protein
MTSRQDMLTYTSAELRSLCAKKKEEARLKKVEQCVADIYMYVIHQATLYDATICSYPITTLDMQPDKRNEQKFYLTNLSDIVTGLRIFFPDARISRRSILRTSDGRDHDISTRNPMCSPLGHGDQMDTLIIDWSP